MLYPVPNVFVTVDGAIVVARALRAVRADGVTVLRAVVAVRTTLFVVALRGDAVVCWFVAVLATDAARDVPDVVAVRTLPDVRLTVVELFLVIVLVALLLDCVVGIRAVRAITAVPEFVVDWVFRVTVFVSRTAASACAMPIKHAIVKIINLFIMYINNDNKNIFL